MARFPVQSNRVAYINGFYPMCLGVVGTDLKYNNSGMWELVELICSNEAQGESCNYLCYLLPLSLNFDHHENSTFQGDKNLTVSTPK